MMEETAWARADAMIAATFISRNFDQNGNKPIISHPNSTSRVSVSRREIPGILSAASVFVVITFGGSLPHPSTPSSTVSEGTVRGVTGSPAPPLSASLAPAVLQEGGPAGPGEPITRQAEEEPHHHNHAILPSTARGLERPAGF